MSLRVASRMASDRDRLLLEYFVDPVRPVPDWASIRTDLYQYVEFYRDGKTIFREYYDLVADPWQFTNLLHDGDGANDPPPGQIGDLSRLLSHDRRCRGTGGRRACP